MNFRVERVKNAAFCLLCNISNTFSKIAIPNTMYNIHKIAKKVTWSHTTLLWYKYNNWCHLNNITIVGRTLHPLLNNEKKLFILYAWYGVKDGKVWWTTLFLHPKAHEKSHFLVKIIRDLVTRNFCLEMCAWVTVNSITHD